MWQTTEDRLRYGDHAKAIPPKNSTLLKPDAAHSLPQTTWFFNRIYLNDIIIIIIINVPYLQQLGR